MTNLRPELPSNATGIERQNLERPGGTLKRFLPDQWSIPYVALLIYTFAFVTARFPVGTPAVVIGLISLLFTKQKLRSAPPINWMIAFWFWACVGYLTSDYPSVVANELYAFLKLILIAFLTVNAIQTRSQAYFFLIFMLAWYCYYPIRVTLMNFFLLDYTEFGRAIGPGIYANPNDLAALTLLQVSIALAILVGLKNRWARSAIGIVALVMLFVIALTQSRGVFLGALTFFALIVGSGKKKVKAFAGLLVAFGILTMMLPPSTFDRFEQLTSVLGSGGPIASADTEGSAAERSSIYRIALTISADNPVTGVGLGSYPLANAKYAIEVGDVKMLRHNQGRVDAHSTYLSALAETGIPGLAFIVLMFASTIRSIFRTRRIIHDSDPRAAVQLRILISGYIGFLIAAFVGTYTQLAMTYVFLCATWAYSESLKTLAYAGRDSSECKSFKSDRDTT